MKRIAQILLIGLFVVGGWVFHHPALASTNIPSGFNGSTTDAHFLISYPTNSNGYLYQSYNHVYPDSSTILSSGSGPCNTWVSGICTADIHWGDITAYPNLWFALTNISNVPDINTIPFYFIARAVFNSSTHIVSFFPEAGTTTASTTPLSVEVYINPNDLTSNSDTDQFNPQIEIDLTSPDSNENISFFYPSATTRIATSGDQTLTSTTTLPDGLYLENIFLKVPAFADFPGQTYDSTSTEFVVNQSAYLATLGIGNPGVGTSTFSLATSTCSFTNVSGCFQNAIVFLFWPNQTAGNIYAQFQSILYQKPPVGYFVVIQKALSGATTTASTTIGWSLPTGLKTNYFSPVRTGIAAILWFFFLIEFWHVIRHIKL